MARRWTAHLKGDVAGGVTAAVLTIPVSMGYGILALQPLGDAYVSYGVVAGLVSAIVVPLTAILLGAESTIVYAPRSVVAFLLGSVVLHNVVGSPALDTRDAPLTLTLAFLVVFAAGLIQALFGRFRLGGLVQYIPSPVMAGFQNAAAILILFAQIDSMLGFREHVPVSQLLHQVPSVHPLTLLVGTVTAVAMWQCSRLTRSVPPAIFGLLAGGATYYLLRAAGLGAGLGPTVGALPIVVPTPAYAGSFVSTLSSGDVWRVLPGLLTGTLSLAIVASFDGLLCAKSVEMATHHRIRGSRELLRLGVGNMVAACFGGIPSGVNLGASFANHRSGARTSASVLVSALLILLAVLLLAPVIALIPRVVVSGLLVVTALQLLDRWSIKILRQMLARQFVYWRSMTVDVLVILLVATVALAANLVTAVGIGLGVAILSFLFRMSRSPVRRAYHGDVLHSRRTRAPRMMELLQARGHEILVLELEGPLFFGTAEDLADRVDAALESGVSWIILDLKRVSEIDSTGARILLQIQERVTQRGRNLMVSHVGPSGRLADFLHDMGVTAALTSERVHADTDRALEWAEDRLIARELAGTVHGGSFPFEHLDILAGLDETECATLRAMLSERAYAKGDVVFREGDKTRELFIIAKGAASVKIRLPGHHRENR